MNEITSVIINSYIGDFVLSFKHSKLLSLQLPNSQIVGNLWTDVRKLPLRLKIIYSDIARLLDKYFADCLNFMLTETEMQNWILPKNSFTSKVYKNLINITAGKTISYKELASLCGNANASRAVGNAMRNNRFPLLIPCHRVIKSSGGLGGYSAQGGLILKQRLLDWEKSSLEKHVKIPKNILTE